MRALRSLALHAALVAAAILTLLPLAWMLAASFVTAGASSDLLANLRPGAVTFEHYTMLFTRLDLARTLANSAGLAATVTSISVLVNALAGYAFAKLRIKGRDGLMLFVVATMAIPTQLGIIPLFILMKDFGWTGELGSVIVPNLVTAFGVFFMRQYLVEVIPDELIEAARVDGANQLRTFFHVAIPAARPAMAILGLFTFMMAWTDFLWPMLMLPQNPTIQVALSQLQSGYYIDYSIVLTGAVMATIPLLLLFVVAGRQLIAGIMQGAIKG
jgi:cellobiose transport system permease protein